MKPLLVIYAQHIMYGDIGLKILTKVWEVKRMLQLFSNILLMKNFHEKSFFFR